MTSTYAEETKYCLKWKLKAQPCNNHQEITNNMKTVTPQVELENKQKLMGPECAMTHQQLEEYSEFIHKTKYVRYALQTNLIACDAKWTLFLSAVFSYRYDSVLRPFPPQFNTEQLCYDIDSLIAVIKDIPKLSIVLQNLVEHMYDESSSDVIDLLYWVLIVVGEPTLRLLEAEEFNLLFSSVDGKPFKIKPTHVFEVISSTGFHSDVAFHARRRNLTFKLAFMGNKLENYFSLLQNGFSKLPRSEEHLKLTTDLETSLQHSPYCAAWGASQCGSIISCTAICEFAFDPEEDKIMPNKNDNSCVDIHLHSTQDIRIRYLIFYGRRLPRHLLSNNRFSSWIFNYKFSLSLLSYMLFLLSIGIANSETGEIFRQYLSKKIEHVLEFCRTFIGKEPLKLV